MRPRKLPILAGPVRSSDAAPFDFSNILSSSSRCSSLIVSEVLA